MQQTPRLALLGGFELSAAEPGQPPRLPRKAKALLAYLALQPGRAQSRDRLAALLWEDSCQTQARQSLRQALAGLRKALPAEGILTADNESVGLDGLEVDALTFEPLAGSQSAMDLERAVGLYGGELLEGFHARADAFDDWLMARRNHYLELALAAHARLLDRRLAEGPDEDALRLAHRLAALAPLRESAHQALMTLYARLGRPAEAVRQYRHLRRLLWRELDAEPEPDTVRLYERILAARGEHRPLAPPGETLAPPARAATGLEPSIPPDRVPSEPGLRQVTLLSLSWIPPEGLMRAEAETLRDQAVRFDALVTETVKRHKGRILDARQTEHRLLFGLPQARSDDPERALRVALSLCGALEASGNGQLRAALDCGQALREGADDDLQLSGPVLHRCADLLRAACAGELLISEAVHRRLHQWVEAEPIQDASLPAWRILSLHQTPSPPTARMVGRESELGLLVAGLDACAEAGVGNNFLIRGEAGIGKTRLVEEVRARAAALGLGSVPTRILDFGTAAAQDPMTSLVTVLLTGSPEPDTAALGRALKDASGLGWIEQDAVSLLEGLLGISETSVEPHRNAVPEQTRERRLRDAMTALLRATSETHPQLLIVEDIHWADPTTLALLTSLAETTPRCPAVLIMTSRVEGEPLDPNWRAAMQGAPLTTLDLGPLRPEQSLRLALELAPEDEGRALACSTRAEGNPLFLEQLLLSRETEGAGVPDSVQSIVLARLDALPGAERQALESASILGQRFRREDLLGLLADPSYDDRALIERRLLRPDEAGLMFAHALIRETVHNSLPASRRRLLHRAAAELYRTTDPVLHARHLAQSGAEDAAEAHVAAARHLIRTFRFDQAATLAQEGLALTRSPLLMHRLSRLAGESLVKAGRMSLARTCLETALASPPTDRDRAEVLLELSRLQSLLDEPRPALESLEQAELAARAAADPDLEADIRFQRGNVLFNLARIDECLSAHRALAKEARQRGSARHEALAESGLGDAYYLRGQMISAHDHFGRCVELARTHGLEHLVPANLGMQAWTDFYRNRVGDGIRQAEEALRIARERSDPYGEGIVYGALGPMLVASGDLERARAIGERHQRLARRIGSSRYLADSLWTLADIHGLLGDRARAVGLAREGWEVLGEAGRPYAGAIFLGLMARFTTEPAERRDCIERGERLLTQGTISHNLLHFHQAAIDAWLEARDWDRAEHHARALADYSRDEPLPWSDFHLRRGQALAAVGRGRLDAALHRELTALLETGRQARLQLALLALEEVLQGWPTG